MARNQHVPQSLPDGPVAGCCRAWPSGCSARRGAAPRDDGVHGRQLSRRGARRQRRRGQEQGAGRWPAGRLPLAAEAARAGDGLSAHPAAGLRQGRRPGRRLKVRSERNSSTDYIASLDFSFQSKAVRDLLRREGIPFIDEQAPTLTVVPVWRDGRDRPRRGTSRLDQYLEGPRPGARAHAREAADAEEGDPAVRPSMRSPGGDGSAIRSLAANYGSELRPDRHGRARSGCQAPQRHARRAAMRSAPSRCSGPTASTRPILATPASWRPWSRWASSRGAGRRSRRAVAAAVVGGTGAVAASGTADLLIAVEFRGMGEWQDISRKLAATPGIEELDVAGLSARGARVTLRYAEAPSGLPTPLPARALPCATWAAIGSSRLQ